MIQHMLKTILCGSIRMGKEGSRLKFYGKSGELQ